MSAQAALRRVALPRLSPTAWLAVLWTAFLGAHLLTLWSGWVLPNQPMGDVYNVYEPWSGAIADGRIMGVTETWVYPPLALWPMIAARAIVFVSGYTLQWAVLVLLANAIGFAFLLGSAKSLGRRSAAGFWVMFVLLLGPVGLYRLDAVTVPMTVVAVLWLARFPAVASILLAVAAWIKIWPGALLLAAFAVLRTRVTIAACTLGFSALLCLIVVLGGGGGHLFGFLTEQTDRGLQVEAPLALPYLWGAMAHVPDTAVMFNYDIITFQVTGPGVQTVAALTLPLLALSAVGLAWLGFARSRAGVPAQRLLPPLAMALVLTFIITNKVGSPQFQTWLVAPAVLWLLWDRRSAKPVVLGVLGAALLTQIVYPMIYDQVLVAAPGGVLVLTARNVVLVWLLIHSVRRVLELRPHRIEPPSVSPAAAATRRDLRGERSLRRG